MKTLWISTALLCLGLSLLTANLSLAAFGSQRIESRLQSWSYRGHPQDDREWQALYDENERWYTLFPHNPRHLRNRTRLLEWRSFLQRLYPDYARKSATAALEGHRQLTQLAPSLGFAWASIAEIRADQSLFDEETIEALDHAAALGPIEDLAQRRIIRAGITHWGEWPPASRHRIKETIENALQTDTTLQRYPISSFVYDVVLSNRWEDELQLLLNSERLRNGFEQSKRARKARSRRN